MFGMGTIFNAFAILVGGGAGILLKKGLPERFRKIVFDATATAVFLIGLTGVMSGALKAASDGAISSQYILNLLLSLASGAVIGELLRIDRGFDKVAEWIKKKFSGSGDSKLGEGFAATTILFCAGAMAIVGSIEDGIMGNPTTLYTKGVIDAISGVIFGSVYGVGVLLSAGSVFVYQGALTLLASLIAPYLGEIVVSQMSMVGSAVLMLIAFDMWEIRKFNVANLIPAAFMPLIFSLVQNLF
ncbi:MAG: DUF554 domain-containing protein [Clostridia bacterium]|nr:DUF554 domain-containing protein [Clostridia bacterium]MBQ2326437.1 DUF554 domain-containing protein [Clostridia bacterium]MBQ5813932.1 DUF554 domain-containing protein [Clostridia bacterium]